MKIGEIVETNRLIYGPNGNIEAGALGTIQQVYGDGMYLVYLYAGVKTILSTEDIRPLEEIGVE